MDLIHVPDAKMRKNKPARGKGYTAGLSFIINIATNNKEAKIHLDSGAFCNCSGRKYIQTIHINWTGKLMPIRGIKFCIPSQDMNPLGILEAEMIFPHPEGIIRLKFKFFVMNNCTSQHFTLGNSYLNIYGVDINNYNNRYFTIGEQKRKYAFPP
ncbi:hypothetical protein O181_123913 [Austropuccinia psidii MF-1]|uniref:Uncharacterized protein n=1 Tax=Austropuccinia psidii MF-1 TaxID=1389203 RepID=A0A9Q3KMM8_9BASI|nr:hypothetical protein [Austropuccinia psidii MF-1]